jgi:hypothetical protein
VVIGDFGLSKLLHDAMPSKNAATDVYLRGAYRYLAPELLNLRTGAMKLTLESDAYAFALTTWVRVQHSVAKIWRSLTYILEYNDRYPCLARRAIQLPIWDV